MSAALHVPNTQKAPESHMGEFKSLFIVKINAVERTRTS